MTDQWIVVKNWEKFQHYKDRDPPWIKLYTSILHDDEYLKMPPYTRLVLLSIWILYSRSCCQLIGNTASLSRQASMRITRQHLERLEQAGFITFSDSKPIARSYQRTSNDASAMLHRGEKNSPPYPLSGVRGRGRPSAATNGGPAFTPGGQELVGSNAKHPVVEVDGRELVWKGRRLYTPDDPQWPLGGMKEAEDRIAAERGET